MDIKEGNVPLKKFFAEFFGTFWLVFAGSGSAVVPLAFPDLGVGFAGVALALGLTVLTMAYAFGSISGGHFNPAVSLGLMIAGRLSPKQIIPYWIAQLAGAVAAAAIIYLVAAGRPDFATVGVSTNAYNELSQSGFGLESAFLIETLLIGMVLLIMLGSTVRQADPGFSPIAIGLTLTLIHLVSILVTKTSVDPARSTGAALFPQTDTLSQSQLWLFWAASMIGVALGALILRILVPPVGDSEV